jgi:hypothetical protein
MARDLRKLARHDRLEVGVLRWHHSGILAKRARRKAHICGDKLEVSSRPRDRKNYDRARAKAKRMRARRKASLPTVGLAFTRGSQGGDAFSKLALYNGATERSYLRKLEALQRLRQPRLGGRRPAAVGLEHRCEWRDRGRTRQSERHALSPPRVLADRDARE